MIVNIHPKTDSDVIALSNSIEICPHCGARSKRKEIILIEIGEKWDRVRCPKCRRVFGVKVR